MKTRIIVDSTADLTPPLRAQVYTVPLTVRFGDEEYVDGVTIDHRTFYEKLVESNVLPTTSQASPRGFARAYDRAEAAGEEAVVITVASTLSGTYQSAMIAAEGRPGIHVVDSGTAAIGGGILAERALQLADAGMDAAAIARQLEAEKQEIVLVALVDTLEYLRRGGRISRTAAVAGTLLNVKPVLALEAGEIRMLGKARGSRQGNNLLAEEIGRAGGVDFTRPVLLGYTGMSDALLRKYMEDSRALWEHGVRALSTTAIGSVIGTHVGPGAVAVAFFRSPGTQQA